jgi:hypothetical protein
MDEHPWITFRNAPNGGVLTQDGQITEDRLDAGHVRPSIITVVGRKLKTTLLEQFLGTLSIPVHQQVYLRALPKRRGGPTPVVIIDCGVLRGHSATDPPRNSTSWEIPAQENITATITSKVFSPFSGVVVYFVSDLGGLKSVVGWLAAHATSALASDLPVLPRILLVIDTTSDSFDESIAASRASSQLLVAMQNLKHYASQKQAQEDINCHFRDITVLGLKSTMTNEELGRIFKRRLLALSDLSVQDRSSAAVHFNLSHFQALSKKAIECLSRGEQTIRIAHMSRPHGFSIALFEHCLKDLFTQLPSQSWLWNFSSLLIASALLLSSYPPGSHGRYCALAGRLSR